MQIWRSLDVISFHPGKQHNLDQAKQLSRYFESFRHLTSLFFPPALVARIAKTSPALARKLARRSAKMQHSDSVKSHMLPELWMLLKRVFGRRLRYKDFISRNTSFQNWVIRRYVPPRIAIGYDGSSWKVFEKWKGKSFLVLDLAVAVPEYKRVLADEINMDDSLRRDLIADDAVIYDIYRRELQLADLILCGSPFVKASCIAMGVDPNKLELVRYGVDLQLFKPSTSIRRNSDPLRVCFVGNVSYRKGADVLLRVWKRIASQFPGVELHFYGNVQIPLPAEMERVFFHGYIGQGALIRELQQAQISVLPSFFEGSSIAIYQSMAMGLAVVTTLNAGSIVEDGRNGLLVEYGDENSLFEKLVLLIENESERKRIAENALHDIRDYSWDKYGNRLAGILYGKLSKRVMLPVREWVRKSALN